MRTMTPPRSRSTESSRGSTGPGLAGVEIEETSLPEGGADAMTTCYHTHSFRATLFDTASVSSSAGFRIVIQIRSKPFLDLLQRHAFAKVVIEELVAAQLAYGKVF